MHLTTRSCQQQVKCGMMSHVINIARDVSVTVLPRLFGPVGHYFYEIWTDNPKNRIYNRIYPYELQKQMGAEKTTL